MKYFVEESLSNFKFWSGGQDRAKLLSDEQFDIVEQMLEDGIKEANQLYQDCIHNYTLVISIERWMRFQLLIPWTANAIYYGVLGNK